MVDEIKIIADNGEGCTVEEGTKSIEIGPTDTVLVLRKDMTHRLIVPEIERESEVEFSVLSLTAIAMLTRDDHEWLKELVANYFSTDEDEEHTSFGPITSGNA